MNTSKVVVVANTVLGKMLTIIGYLLGAFMVLGLIGTISSGDAYAGMVIFAMISIAIALFLILRGRRIKKTIKRFKAYVGLISYEHITSLDSLAGSTSQSVDFVRKDLQHMIDKKFFANAYLDFKANEIIIGASAPQLVTSPTMAPQMESVKTESVECPGCGAGNIRPVGAAIDCEYCGSHIN